jgi:two-component system alkaline phosphatase synthesis response regulator PhoP
MPKKVFIIDDDRDMVDSLTMVLEGHGYGVEATYTASDAMEKVRVSKPDLIILDVMFPENSSEGFDLARKLHQDDIAGKIPIIMLSAINVRFNLGFSEKDRDETWLPVTHFIEKPVVPEKLIKMVKDTIGS